MPYHYVNRGPYWVALLARFGWPPERCQGLMSLEKMARTFRRGPGAPWDHVFPHNGGRWVSCQRPAPTRADPEHHPN